MPVVSGNTTLQHATVEHAALHSTVMAIRSPALHVECRSAASLCADHAFGRFAEYAAKSRTNGRTDSYAGGIPCHDHEVAGERLKYLYIHMETYQALVSGTSLHHVDFCHVFLLEQASAEASQSC